MQELSNMAQRVHQQKFTIDQLVSGALRSRYPGATWITTPFYDQQKSNFQEVLVRSARIASSGKPQEISKIQVDVNEKIYSNYAEKSTPMPERTGDHKEPDGDKSTVEIVKTTEVSEGYNYQQQTSSGFEWGAGTNIGAQFGLPQVGIGVSAGASANFTKTNMTTNTVSSSTSNKISQESHHEENVTIPPRHKVSVTMTSYRVKYRLDYTMEYTVPKSASIRVRYYTCCSCGLFTSSCLLDASRILRTMPDFKEDGQHVTFTQQGCLTWFADRMEVDKKVAELELA